SEDAAAGLLLNAVNFPDANFRAALAEILKISEGDEITAEKIAATTSLDVSKSSNTPTEEKIADLTGIEHFTALTELWCYRNQLTSLDVSQNTALQYLWCFNNQLTSLDVSKNTALGILYCYGNQLTSLNVSGCTALTSLSCNNNQLTSLDVSKNTALTRLSCYRNQLTSLDVSQNTALEYLFCFNNQIKGKEMDALVASLPTVGGNFCVIDTQDENEGNVCTKSQVAIAKGKGWTVCDYNGWQEYEGSDDPEQEIDPVDEDDNIDYGNDMDENSDLDGNVIGDIFYNISSGNGEYNSEEGCIVVTKPTDDGTVSDLEGKDIFGEDFKSQFTGIVFKVPAGKGTIKVDAETTGNMLLKVKIGSNEPVEMELNGKLKVTFPYNVSEATYVYIYAGAANEAKGFGKASATDAALKIYGIEFLRDDTPTDIDRPTPDPSLNGGESWYTIDGVKLNGEPTKKGVYIVKGKKVKR
ncbi:MAG: leucine-rich repeat domain-containing protein, partial [Prevotella sp.]|nr:leucine-rich repeat domain-containing protein [Prevotella sp.]